MISWWSWLSLLETFSSQFFLPIYPVWLRMIALKLGGIGWNQWGMAAYQYWSINRIVSCFWLFKTLFGDPSAHYNSNSYDYNLHQSVIACISELIFPTCQMRVVRFYVSCPRPPSVPRRTRTATSGAKCSLPDLQYMSKYLSEYMPWNTMVGITRSIFFCQYQFINIIVLPNGMFDSSASLVFLMQMLAQWLRSFSPGR